MPDRRAEPPRGPRNPDVAVAAQLHRASTRKDRGQTLIEGPNLLAEALEAGVTVHTVFALSEDTTTFELGREYGLDVTPVSETALVRLADTRSPRGPVAVVDIPELPLATDHNVLVAWGVSEPGNVGALVRTAAGFGWGYAYTPGSADPWGLKTLRAGAGGHFHTPIVPIDGPGDLDNWNKVATVVAGGQPLETVDGRPVAVLIGQEAAGLPEEVVAGADHRVTITTTSGIESLNAAVAAGIIVHALTP